MGDAGEGVGEGSTGRGGGKPGTDCPIRLEGNRNWEKKSRKNPKQSTIIVMTYQILFHLIIVGNII